MSNFPEIDILEVIYNCGYYDQMHFIHEFKAIMGYPPMEFLKKCQGKFYFVRPLVSFEKSLNLK